jgi:hypothetical protein
MTAIKALLLQLCQVLLEDIGAKRPMPDYGSRLLPVVPQNVDVLGRLLDIKALQLYQLV